MLYRGRRFYRAIATLLIMAIVGTSSSVSIAAETVSAAMQKNEKKVQSVESTDEGEREKQEEKTESSVIDKSLNTTTFEYEDGRKELVAYGTDIRFIDEDGELTDYNPSLVKIKDLDRAIAKSFSAYAYTNKSGDYKHYMPKKLTQSTPIVLENQNHQISLHPIQNSVSSLDEEEQEIAEVELGEVEILSETVENLYEEQNQSENTAAYAALDKSLELQYKSLETGVNECIVLNEIPTSNILSFQFSLKDLTVELDETNNQIVLYTGENKVAGYFESPSMNDSSNEAYSEDIEYQLTKVDGMEDTYIVDLVISQQYLKSEQTQYPISVSSLISWSTSSKIEDVYVIKSSAYSDTNFYSDGVVSMAVGTNSKGTYRSYLKFNELQKEIAGKYVESANLTFYETGSSEKGVTVTGHRVKENWKPNTITWNNKPTSNTTPFASFKTTGTTGAARTLDLTALLRNNANGTGTDYGIMLQGSDGFAQFYSARHSTASKRIKMSVVYYDGPSTATSVSVNSRYIKKGSSLNVNWAGIESKGLAYVQYRIVKYNPKTQELGAQYVAYDDTTKIGTTSTGTKTIAASKNWDAGCYRIFVRGVDKGGIKGTGKGATFYIDEKAPTISKASISPATDQTAYTTNDRPVISWTASDDNLISSIQYSIDGKKTFTTISSAASGTYKIPSGVLTKTAAYPIIIRVIDKAGNYKDSTTKTYYYEDKKPPVVNEISISPNGKLVNDKTPVITWDVSDANFKNIEYKINNGAYTVLAQTQKGNAKIVNKAFEKSGNYIITIKAQDIYGNSALKEFTYNLDVVAPNVKIKEVNESEKNGNLTLSLTDENFVSGKEYKEVYYYIASSKEKEPASSQYTKLTSFEQKDGLLEFEIPYGKLDNDIYSIYVKVKDVSGNVSAVAKQDWYHMEHAPYDGTLVLTGSYEDETGQIEFWWEEQNFEEASLYASRGNEGFKYVKSTSSDSLTVDVDIDSPTWQYRIVVKYKDGTYKSSNILSYVREEFDEEDSDEADWDEDEDEEEILLTDDDETEDELWYDNVALDSDEDGLLDGYEIWDIGSDPYNTDSDGDGFDDFYEVTILGTSPIIKNETVDSDGDGLTDYEEYKLGTNPYLADSDFDGLNDKEDENPFITDSSRKYDGSYKVTIEPGLYDSLIEVVDEEGNTNKSIVNVYGGLVKEAVKSDSTHYIYYYNKEYKASVSIICTNDKEYINTFYYDGENVKYVYHNGFGYDLSYDSKGKIDSIYVNNDVIISNNYEEGKISNTTFGNGQGKTYEYKEGYTVIKGSNGDEYEYVYDENGKIISYKDNVTGTEFSYSYDSETGKFLNMYSSDGFSIESKDTTETKGIETQTKVETIYEYQGVSKSTSHITIQYEKATEDSESEASSYSQILLDGSELYTSSDGKTYHTNKIKLNNQGVLTTEYKMVSDKIEKIEYSDGSNLSYEYNSDGFITAIYKNGTLTESFEYDGLGQLTRENNKTLDKTVVYQYDLGGNIKSKTIYKCDFTTKTKDLSNAVDSVKFGYQNDWTDILVSYDGQEIKYDKIGNPLSYRDGMNFTWDNGRQLSTYKNDSIEASYTYDANGIRTSKTVNGVTTKYLLDESKIIAEVTEDSVIWYLYDAKGTLIGFEYDGESYYYKKNAQNDVCAIYNKSGEKVVEYIYDALGNVGAIEGDTHIGNLNPFRYRSYYYDNETGLYYLVTRYYDSQVGRFLSMDIVLGANGDNISFNLFAYCSNNFMNASDPNGMWVVTLGAEASAAAVLGGYVSYQYSIDDNRNFLLSYSYGAMVVIFNVVAGISIFLGVSPKYDTVDSVIGKSVSFTGSVAVGAKVEGGFSLDIGLDPNAKGSGNLGMSYSLGGGAGWSLAPIPSGVLKLGKTNRVLQCKLKDLPKVTTFIYKKILGDSIEIAKKRGGIVVKSNRMRLKVTIYKRRTKKGKYMKAVSIKKKKKK